MLNIKTVVVTGASGFLGSVVVDKLLDAGYTVRGTVRSGKAQRVRDAYASFGDRFSVAIIDDLSIADFTDAFKGADALIHAASPLAGAASAEVVIKSAVDGTIRVLNYAHKAGIRKIVVTASIISLNHPAEVKINKTYTENDWNPQTREEALKPDYPPFFVYAASKKLAEEALWNFAKTRPELDVATIHPAFLYGPTGRGQVIDVPADGTNTFIYSLINGPKGRPLHEQAIPPVYVHVADAATAHVLALKAPPSDKPKRIVNVGGYFTWKDAVEYLYATRPALRDRLPSIPEGCKASVDEWCRWDVGSSERIIGFGKLRIGRRRWTRLLMISLLGRRGWESLRSCEHPGIVSRLQCRIPLFEG